MMTQQQKIILAISLILNIILFGVIVFLSQNQPSGSNDADAVAQAEASATSPATLTPVPTATLVPPTMTETAVPTIEPPQPPTETALPLPTATSVPPTETPLPPPTATPIPTPVPGPIWLRYTNLFRDQAGLTNVVENTAWSEGSRLHSVYLVYSGQYYHDEDLNDPYYTEAGRTAGKNGNVALTNYLDISSLWPIDYWISAPFHAVPILDPRLQAIGYGEHRDAAGFNPVAATMDIKSGLGELPAGTSYPIFFPEDGGETWVLQHLLPEYPNPITSCPNLSRPTGPPIILQLGTGELTPVVTAHSFFADGEPLNHCIFDETSYTNSDSWEQRTGRIILDQRDAVVLMPQHPLEIGKTYTVNLTVNGQPYTWGFSAVTPPETPLMTE